MTQEDDVSDIQININYLIETIGSQDFRPLIETICRQFNLMQAEINITVTDDNGIIEINKQFLNKETTTDVISFDSSDEDCSERIFDLVVNWNEAVRQAQTRNHHPEAELALYITHGLLHHLGYDDSAPDEAEKMHKKEDEILHLTGFGVTYYDG